jgi:hypothetical protein
LPTGADHRTDGEPVGRGRAVNGLCSTAEDGRVARRAAGDDLIAAIANRCADRGASCEGDLLSSAEDGRVARRAAGDDLNAAIANRCADRGASCGGNLLSSAEDGRADGLAAGVQDDLEAAGADGRAEGLAQSGDDLLSPADDRRAFSGAPYEISGAAVDRTADRPTDIDLHSAAAQKRDSIGGLSAHHLHFAAAGDLDFAAGTDRYPDGVAVGKDELDPAAEDGRVARHATRGDLFLSPGTNRYPPGGAVIKDGLHPAAEDGRVARHAQR